MSGLIASSERRVIVGLGTTGLSVARYFARVGKPFAMLDTRAEPPGLADFQREFPEATLSLGGWDHTLLDGATEVVVSPGVSIEEPALQQAADNGAELIGDIELFRREAQAPIVAITGTNGKSTVTTLVGEMARAAGLRTAVGGNLGTPALDLLADEVALYVLELSSFQLETTRNLGAKVATVLNMSADHFDRYADMPAYHAAKHRIFQNCQSAVVNKDDPLSQPLVADDLPQRRFGLGAPDLREYGLEPDGDQLWLNQGPQRLLRANELRLQGRHNLANALAALALAELADIDREAALNVLRDFTGLPHRCQWVAEKAGVTYVNDSKGTNVGATAAAIAGLGVDRPLILLAGGVAKGQDFSPLTAAARDKVRLAVVFGIDAPLLADALKPVAPVAFAEHLPEAVAAAAEQAQAGDVVLLSPACASFDQFSDYRARGEAFVEAVEALP